MVGCESWKKAKGFVWQKKAYVFLGLCLTGAFFYFWDAEILVVSFRPRIIAVFYRPPFESPPKFERRADGMACRLPQLNPWDARLKKYIANPRKEVNCLNGHPLIFTTDQKANLIQLEDPAKFNFSNCCYQKFTRTNKDSNIKIDSRNCLAITEKETQISAKYDYIQVLCDLEGESGNFTRFPVDMFGFVHLKSKVESRVERILREKELPSEGASDRMNVVVLGIDAVSHMNFQRTMSKTREFILKDLGAIGMDGYVKVGDNTFPNMVPALMGKSLNEIKSGCWPTKNKPFDECPFIWKNYTASGYRTAYGEDSVWMGIFNYAKRGFKEAPTDYYNNPLTYFLERRLGHHHLMTTKLCYGPRIGFSVSLKFLKNMAATMDKTRRYFQFIWATSLTHDYLNQGRQGDLPLLETLKWFQTGRHLNHTVFILMSDHGLRWGDIRSTLQGRYEERMPFLYFMLPAWFKDKYRTATSNLLRNSERLTTPFDLHETLLDLLNVEQNLSGEKLRERHAVLDAAEELPRGISLFLAVPKKRTCADAEIADHWCVCRSMTPVAVQGNLLVDQAARSVVHHINGFFTRFPQCKHLELKSIINAQVLQSSNARVTDVSANITHPDDGRLRKQEVTYSLALSVLPSNAMFEATITRHTDGNWEVSGEISRTNLYGEQSVCVSDYNMKKFCYC